MSVQQQFADLSSDVTELRHEASEIATATEQTLDELLQNVEALQQAAADAKSSRTRLVAPSQPQPVDGPWRSRFESFILKQREQSESLAQASASATRLLEALADATSAVEDADCTPSMRSFLMNTLQMLNALAAAESRRRGLLAL